MLTRTAGLHTEAEGEYEEGEAGQGEGEVADSGTDHVYNPQSQLSGPAVLSSSLSCWQHQLQPQLGGSLARGGRLPGPPLHSTQTLRHSDWTLQTTVTTNFYYC